MELDRFKTKEDAIRYLRDKKGFKTNREAEDYLRGKIPHESKYQAKIIRFLKSRYPDAVVWKAAAGPYSIGGIPDVCMVVAGTFFAFEVKRPYFGEASELQKAVIKNVRRAGCMAAVVCFPEECEELLTAAGIYPRN